MSDKLANIFWLGGATDSGKTSISQLLVGRYGLQLYPYDRTDVPHHEILAQKDQRYADFVNATFDGRWVQRTVPDLVDYTLHVINDRWPLVLADLEAMPSQPPILVEGFGLAPDLVAPLLQEKRRAIWLMPTDEFKLASMERRNKPPWRFETSNPELARQNLQDRDRLIAEEIRRQAMKNDLTLHEVDGSLDAEEMATLIAFHFGLEEG